MRHKIKDKSITVRVVGRWLEGGIVEVLQDGVMLDYFLLGQVEWAVVALLAERSIQSQEEGWESAFITARELARELVQRTEVAIPEHDNVIRSIHRIRKRFGKSCLGAILGLPDFGKQLFETQQFLGYRLSLPPQSISLKFLDRRDG